MTRSPRGSQYPMGACAPISDSNDIFIDEEAGLAAVKAAPLNALKQKKASKDAKHSNTKRWGW